MFRSPAILGAALAVLAVAPHALAAQNPQTRQGFFISFGFGGGSFGCETCDGRETGPGVLLNLGGTLSPSMLLGADLSGWSKEENGARVTHANATAAIQFYPAPATGFWLKGGLGLSSLEIEFSGGGFSGSVSDSGLGLTGGLGYDIRLGSNFSLTPYVQGGLGNFEGGSANNAQIGLAATFH